MPTETNVKSDVATSTACAFVTSLMFFACPPAASASTQVPASLQPSTPPISNHVATARPKKEEEERDDISSTKSAVLESPLQKVEAIVKFHSFAVDRKSETEDGGLLFEFLKEDVRACVEVFPNGDLVIIVNKDGPADLYEFTIDDVGSIPSILKDAGVPRRKL